MFEKLCDKLRYKITKLLQNQDTKIVLMILSVEFLLYLFVAGKGFGGHYLPIALLLAGFSLAGCMAARYVNADRYLLMIVLILLNLGFVVQELESGQGVEMSKYLQNMSLTILAVFLVFLVYCYLAEFLSKDVTVWGMMAFQLLICGAVIVFGEAVGDKEGQGAVLLLSVNQSSITPLELVKVAYPFVAAALLCKEEKFIRVFCWKVKRELLLLFHTALLAMLFLMCRELGTFLVIYLTGLTCLLLFSRYRRLAIQLGFLSLTGFLIFWMVSDQILFPLVNAGKLELPGPVMKVVQRFGTVFQPENTRLGAGYQGTLALESIAMGGVFGISTERYRLPLPQAASDMIFANLVQTCGFLMGSVVIICYSALLQMGVRIAAACKSTYYHGLTMTIAAMLTLEAVIHIGYNVSFLPITGIPLYFVSQGFTAIVTSMSLFAVLMVISTGIDKKE